MIHLIKILQAELLFFDLSYCISRTIQGKPLKSFLILKFYYKESNTTLDINNVVEAEAVLIGGLLDSDMYPVIGEKWENEFLRSERNKIHFQSSYYHLIC